METALWWLGDSVAVVEVGEHVGMVLLVAETGLRAAMWVSSDTGDPLGFVAIGNA